MALWGAFSRNKKDFEAMNKLRQKARFAVRDAVNDGVIPNVKTQKCVDCGKQAFCYDHRDYRKPLKVDPVCKSCDCFRGAGAPYDGWDQRWEWRRKQTKKRLKALKSKEAKNGK